jgi:hypothetical protein
LPRAHLGLDRPDPGPRVLVGDQRHRRHFPGAMAIDAFRMQDRSDVFRKRRGRFGCDRNYAAVNRGEDDTQCESSRRRHSGRSTHHDLLKGRTQR